MPLAARFSLLHSDLSGFLFASVGDEQNGMSLNVISALTRLGVDPWEEAARLAGLPKALAAEALAPMIARLPIARPLALDNLAVSYQLVELLPRHAETKTRAREPTAAQRDKGYYSAIILLGCVALGAAALTAIL